MKFIFVNFKITFYCTSFFLSICSFCIGQEEASIWYFGSNAGIDFSSGTPVAIFDGQLDTLEGCATIANTYGDLLFYTDGVTVWDKNHNIMPNGTGLMGNSSTTQSAIIVPKPENTDVYYIFTIAAQTSIDGFRYSEVNMTLNSGNGDVTINKNIQILNAVSEKISVIKHSNNNDYWVVVHEWNSNDFSSFVVSENGINSSPVISTSGSYHGGENNNSSWGYLKLSPNGKRLALAKSNSINGVEIFDFDNNIGTVSNAITLGGVFTTESAGAYGIEFSPDSKILYVSDLNFMSNQSKVHQFDLTQDTQTSILNSDTIIYEGDKVVTALQLAIDGRIYVGNFNESFLDVIEMPNMLGLDANYVIESVSLGDRICLGGLPSFIQTFFYEEVMVSIFVPEGISPNGDGLNDNLDLVNANVSSLKIFNRNGTLVYSARGYTDEWYGQSNDGASLPVGVYFMSIIFNENQTHTSWIYLNK